MTRSPGPGRRGVRSGGCGLPRATERREPDDHRDRGREHDQRDHLVLAKAEDIRRVRDAQKPEQQPADRVPRGGEPEDQAIREPAAAQRERGRDAHEIPDHVVAHDEVHRAGLAQRVRMRVADAEAQRRLARDGMVLAVDDVADAPDGEPKRDPRRSRVSTESDGQTAPNSDEKSAKRPKDRATPDRDAASPDQEDLQRIGQVVLPLVDDVNEPRAEDAADNTPRGDRSGVLFRDTRLDEPQRKPHAEQDADRGEDAMPSDRERTDVNVGIERNSDHETTRAAPRVTRRAGSRERELSPRDEGTTRRGAERASFERARTPSRGRTRGATRALTSRDTS